METLLPNGVDRNRAGDKARFVFLFGVMCVGVPLALATNALALWMRDDLGLLFSLQNSFELAYTLMLVAPITGMIAGNAIWNRRVRSELPRVDVASWSHESNAEVSIDREQRRLSELQTRLDALARSSPGALGRRALGFALLGYGYVIGVFALLIGAFFWLRHHELGGFAGLGRQMLGWYAFFILTALWVRLAEPTGRLITRAGSPALFDTLEDIQRKLNAPAPDVVVLDWQLNASVSEIPRYGIFGMPRRYLSIGLPLLEGLPADECRAILAHEMAHLSRRHGRRLAWTGRLSVTWQALALNLEMGRHWGRALFVPFFRWYAPRLALYAQAVARRDEYEADALAAECVGADAAARALLRLHLCGRFLQRDVLPRVHRESATVAEPPAGVFEWMATALRSGPSQDEIERWAPMMLAERTLDQDTHPSLADRIVRLGGDSGDGAAAVQRAVDGMRTRSGASGAEELLGERRLPKLRRQIEDDWQKTMLEPWRRWHSDARLFREKPDNDGNDTPLEALWAHARWATDCEPSEVALPLVREVLRRDPQHLEATVYLGRLLADSSDAEERNEGLRILRRAVFSEGHLALLACETLETQYARLGDRDGVQRMQVRQRQLMDAMLRGLRERVLLRPHDRLTPYPLPAATLATIQRACATQSTIRRVFLVRKETEYLRDQPCVYLAVECAVPWYKPSNGEDAKATCRALRERVILPEAADLLAVPIEPRSSILRKLRKLEGAEIYSRMN
jgi:Zn-dependent protease with chaperone function